MVATSAAVPAGISFVMLMYVESMKKDAMCRTGVGGCDDDGRKIVEF